jgi:hypothetical protein
MDKCSSLIQQFVNYVHKKFYKIGHQETGGQNSGSNERRKNRDELETRVRVGFSSRDATRPDPSKIVRTTAT